MAANYDSKDIHIKILKKLLGAVERELDRKNVEIAMLKSQKAQGGSTDANAR